MRQVPLLVSGTAVVHGEHGPGHVSVVCEDDLRGKPVHVRQPRPCDGLSAEYASGLTPATSSPWNAAGVSSAPQVHFDDGSRHHYSWASARKKLTTLNDRGKNASFLRCRFRWAGRRAVAVSFR
jgi:hypothetical protein